METRTRTLVEVKREFLMNWKLIEERRNQLLWRVPQMSDEEVEAAYEELMNLATNMDRLDDLISEWDES